MTTHAAPGSSPISDAGATEAEAGRAPSRSLARIAALLRKAEGTDNEHEADAYLKAAQRLATAAAVDLAVARLHAEATERRDSPTQREVVVGEAGRRGLRTYVELFVAIAAANDVTCDIARNSTRVFAYGFDSDLDATNTLYASLIVQMVGASDRYIKSGSYLAERVRRFSKSSRRWEVGPVSPITARLSFQRAFAARIGRRLAEARKAAMAEALAAERADARAAAEGDGRWVGVFGQRRHAAATASAGAHQDGHRPGPSVALAIRTKELELADHYRANSKARGHWKGSMASAGYSEHAARAGDAAGRRARLGTERAIGGARRALGG